MAADEDPLNAFKAEISALEEVGGSSRYRQLFDITPQVLLASSDWQQVWQAPSMQRHVMEWSTQCPESQPHS